MSAAPPTPLTESRKPHTVYLTADVWSAIERGHLELRLREPSAPSKIEYIEQVLRAGLTQLAPAQRGRPWQPATTPPPAPTVSTEAPHVTPAVTTPPIAAQRRPTALERLKQASDPGQPAPIRSVADTT